LLQFVTIFLKKDLTCIAIYVYIVV